MNIRLREGRAGTIEVDVSDAPANAPEWIHICPDEAIKIGTLPINLFHAHDGLINPSGVELIDAARRYLAGAADQATTEMAIAKALTEWCEASR